MLIVCRLGGEMYVDWVVYVDLHSPQRNIVESSSSSQQIGAGSRSGMEHRLY